jgi:hypothetical protein
MRHVAWKGDIALAKVIVTKGGSVEGNDGDNFTPLLGLTGAHRHHNLGILVHLVVHLDQLEFDDATDMDASRRRIGGSCHHPAPSQLHLLLTADALLGWHVACVCRRGESGVGVFMSATLALQPGVGAFLAPLRLVLRGT